MPFPASRPRRLRHSDALRKLVCESELGISHLISPIFICDGRGVRREIPSMPGVFQLSVDQAVDEAKLLRRLKIPAAILFGVPPRERKDAQGAEAWSENGLVQQATRAIKEQVPELLLIADTCFCEYTEHGHCGVLDSSKRVDNDRTLENLAKTAVSQARASADLIAPSGMMDGMVKTIRGALDAHGFSQTGIMAYSVKYASAFYGPFREAADAAPAFGDRRQYQMDCHNAREARREALLDAKEGADIIMVKPALAYLDVLAQVRQAVDLPVCAYNVSGEYSMVKAAARMGWLDERSAVLELAAGIRRAGADMLITYWAKNLAEWLSDQPLLALAAKAKPIAGARPAKKR